MDLTADVCRERGVTVDEARFNELLEEQKNRARAAGSSRWPRPEVRGHGHQLPRL